MSKVWQRAPLLVLAAALLLFFAGPLAWFLAFAFATFVEPGVFASTPTLANVLRLFQDGYAVGVLATTARVGLAVTLVCIGFGYPIAYFLARESGPARHLVLLIVTASLFTNLLVRTYGWIVLLSPRGALNAGLQSVGAIDAPLRLMFNEAGVVIGLAQIMLPIFVLVAAGSISAIDRDLERAAEVAGAGPVRVFLKITLPLSLPGILNGAALVFALSVSNFITPDFLGGGRVLMVGSMIHQLVSRTLNYPFAAAVALALLAAGLAVALALMLAARLLGERRVVTP